MRSFITILGFAAIALGQITRGTDSVSATYTESGPHGPPATSLTTGTASAQQWPAYSKPSTSEGPSASPTPDAPFTFGYGVSGAPTGTDSWGSWAGSVSPTSSVPVYTSKATSAAQVTSHASYSTTMKASTSTKASSAAQATFTGAGSVGKEVAFGVGAFAAGLALVF